jgi:hypothetical protein
MTLEQTLACFRQDALRFIAACNHSDLGGQPKAHIQNCRAEAKAKLNELNDRAAAALEQLERLEQATNE